MEDLGTLSKLRVWHDNKGVASDWHLAKISLSSLLTGDTYVYAGALLASTECFPLDMSLKLGCG
jgi:hypothetical protein